MDNEDHNMETKRGKKISKELQVATTLDTNYTGQDNLERLSYKKFILLLS